MASNKFDFIVNLTHSHNDVLVRVLNCSISDITKYRKGLISLPDDVEKLESLSKFFAQRIRDDIQEKGASIFFANGMPWPKDIGTASRLIAKWLIDPSPISEKDKKNFLYSIACMYTGVTEPKTTSGSDADMDISVAAGNTCNTDTQISYGDNNKRNSVLSILEDLEKTNKTYHFTIYSEAGIKWFTDDSDYFSKWYAALESILSKGSTMDLITNLDGDDTYLAGGISMWLNLFGTGRIQIYHGYAPSNILIYRTLFVVDDTIAFGSFSYTYESSEHSVNITVNDFEDVRKISAINKEIVRNSIPLFKMYSSANTSDFVYDLATYRTLADDAYLASPTPSLFTMPDNVVNSISERCSTELWRKTVEDEKSYLKRLMHDNTVVEILHLPPVKEVLEGKAIVPLTGIVCSSPIYYEPEELLAHLKNLLHFKQHNPQYRLIISEKIISELCIDAKAQVGTFLTIYNKEATHCFYLNNHELTMTLLKLIKKLVAVHALKFADNSAFEKYISDLENSIQRKNNK